MKIAVLTDSSAYLSKAQQEKYKIDVIPLPIIWDNHIYKDLVDISYENFYKKLKNSATLPTTSQPSTGEVKKYIDKYVAQGYTDVIVIPLSSGLSSFYSSLKNFASEEKRINIHLFDPKITCAGEADAAILAARLIKKGADSLSTSELLAIILQGGIKDVNANELAFKLLKEVGNIHEFVNLSFLELTKIKGIGEVKAAKILATVELGKRIFLEEEANKIKINNPKDIYNYAKVFFYGLKQECFYALYLDSNKKILKMKLLFKGTINKSSVHPREIFKEAYKEDASYIVCLHNHPSGNVNPSSKDIEFTTYLVKLGMLHGVYIYDHIIVSDDNYFSFLDNNLLG